MNLKFQDLSEFQKGTFFMLLTVFFTMLAYVISRYVFLYYEISAYNAAFWSFLGAISLSFPFIFTQEKKQKFFLPTLKKYPKALGFTLLVSVFAAFLWFYLLEKLSSDIVSLFDQTNIIWSVFLGVLLLGERIGIIKISALVLSGIGVSLISSAEVNLSPFLLLLSLSVPLLYALQSFIIKKYAKNIDAFFMAYFRTAGMTTLFGIAFSLLGEISFIPFEAFCLFAFAQLSGAIIARIFYIKAHDYMPISQLNFFYILVPVLIFFISPFIEQNFTFSPLKYFGAGLVILGLLIFVWRKHPTNS